MTNQTDWQQIFTQLKTSIRTAIKPHLKAIKEPLPNLGMGAGGDAMKPVDLAAEKAIVDVLNHHKVSFTLISEESGFKKFGDHPDDCYVTVDPIDGTTNLMHGLPFYASSIAVSEKPQLASVYAGMVADLYHDVAYTAFLGRGAFRNDERVSTSKTTSLDEAIVGIDLNAYRTKLPAHIFTALYENIRHTRHFGANAPEVCFVAAGLTDAFIDLRNKIRTTDVAAGFLMVKEAGGVVTDEVGKAVNVPLHPKQTLSFVASGNQEIHRKILNLVKSDV